MNEGILTAQNTPQIIRENEGSTQALSVFLFDQIQIGKNLRFTPGVRLESFNTQLVDTTLTRTQVDGDEFIFLPGFGTGCWARG